MCVGAVEIVTIEPNVCVEYVRLVLGLGIMAIVLRCLKIVKFFNFN